MDNSTDISRGRNIFSYLIIAVYSIPFLWLAGVSSVDLARGLVGLFALVQLFLKLKGNERQIRF